MSFHPSHKLRSLRASGFSLVELLTVIAIISILMTVGAVGIGSILGGKGVTTGVANGESLFDEARSLAAGQGTRTRLLVDITDPKDTTNYLRRILVVAEELDPTGEPQNEKWALTSRGTILPDQVYFSREFSKKDQSSGSKLDEMTLEGVNRKYQGTYLYYEFNSEGVCLMPGASFIIGTGARDIGADRPRVTASAKRDFGGFVVWRNGRTSAFRSPVQMSLPETITNF